MEISAGNWKNQWSYYNTAKWMLFNEKHLLKSFNAVIRVGQCLKAR